MPKNVTITLSEEIARWLRLKAAQENTSVSKLVDRMLEREMKVSGEYQKTYRRWKQIGSVAGVDAAGRMSRDESHARR